MVDRRKLVVETIFGQRIVFKMPMKDENIQKFENFWILLPNKSQKFHQTFKISLKCATLSQFKQLHLSPIFIAPHQSLHYKVWLIFTRYQSTEHKKNSISWFFSLLSPEKFHQILQKFAKFKRKWKNPIHLALLLGKLKIESLNTVKNGIIEWFPD